MLIAIENYIIYKIKNKVKSPSLILGSLITYIQNSTNIQQTNQSIQQTSLLNVSASAEVFLVAPEVRVLWELNVLFWTQPHLVANR